MKIDIFYLCKLSNYKIYFIFINNIIKIIFYLKNLFAHNDLSFL